MLERAPLEQRRAYQAREEAAARRKAVELELDRLCDRRRDLETHLETEGRAAIRRRLLLEHQAIEALVSDLEELRAERLGAEAVAIAAALATAGA